MAEKSGAKKMLNKHVLDDEYLYRQRKAIMVLVNTI